MLDTARAVAVGLVATALVAMLAEPAVAQDDATYEVRFTATFTEDSLSFDHTLGYDTVRLEDGDWLLNPGQPMLPTQTLRIAVPAGMRVTGVRAAETQWVDLPGQYNIFPAQPLQPISQPAKLADFVMPAPGVYASHEVYPTELVEFVGQADLDGQALARVRVYPLRYLPAEQRLSLCTAVELVLEGAEGYVCGDYLPANLSERDRARHEQRVREMVANPERVQVVSSLEPVTRDLPPGDYDYVIITQASWMDDFQPLADWKIRKGVTATIVDLAWIDSEYWGTDLIFKIRNFVQDARSEWGAMYFLLGGDTNVVPPHVRVIDDAIPNDTYYADYDDDWLCEVHVGRASVRTTAAIATFIDKVVTYETDAPLSNYGKTALFVGFDLRQWGSGEGEDLKADIENYYLPGGWTYRWEYDSESGSHKGDVIGYLNQGNNLVNHADHSSTGSMGVGSTNHSAYLNNNDMDNLSNGDRQSILYTLGCWACDYSNGSTCIGEAFVRNNGGGGVAFIGNSRYGWYVPFSDDGASLRFDRYFFRSLFNQQHYTLGDCFSDHKDDAHASDSSQYIYTELTLLGDPELPIWTDDPRILTVTHPEAIEINIYTNFTVQVQYQGSPVDDAVVCLWKDGDIYEIDYTNGSGTASFWIAPTSEGPLYVTARDHNYLPYLGESDAYDGVGPYQLTMQIEGQGSVEADPVSGPYDQGTPVDLTALADAEWCFDHWEDGLSGSDNPATIVMNRNKIVTAVFMADCNLNGISDTQDIISGFALDCNANGVPDNCDIDEGFSPDCQPNGVPDECDLAPPDYVEGADDCVDAQIICPPRTYFGTTELASVDGSASCGASSSTADVWYYYEPYGNGLLSISLCGSAHDTVLSVHSDCPGTTANEIECNDDFCETQSRLEVPVYNGTPYWIRVSGKNGDTGAYLMTVVGPTCSYTAGDEDQNGIPDECEDCGGQIMADANCDGAVNSFDIDPFVLALSDPQAWAAAYPDCSLLCVCDCNADGVVNAFDIDPFAALLAGGG